MQQASEANRKTLWFVASAMLPIVVNLPGLLIAQGLSDFWSMAFFVLALNIGAICIWHSASRLIWRILCVVIYLPVAAISLLAIDLIMVGVLYHRYL